MATIALTASSINAIPAVLRECRQWVLWRQESRKTGEKPTKVPYTAMGRKADSTDPTQWTDFQAAWAAFERGGYSGVGFVFTADDDFCGIDLDDSLDDNGEPLPWAAPIIAKLNSYTENSPSGHGVKVWIRGKLPDRTKHKTKHGTGEVELYDNKRYFTVTGEHRPETPPTVEDRQAELEWLVNLLVNNKVKAKLRPSPGVPDDDTRVAIEAIEHLSATRADDYNLWLAVGMAAHTVDPGREMLDVWNRFSRWSAKYVEGEPARKWQSFTGGPSQIGELISWAMKDSSWRPLRQQKHDQQADVAGAGDCDGGDEGDEKGERCSQAQLLVNLAEDVELWHDSDTAYATVQVEDHREKHPINGKAFRSWLTRQFWLGFKKVPGAQALQDALGVLGAKALYEGQQRPVAVRVAEQDGAIYLDLANENWQVVKITEKGWEVITDPPVMFMRKRGMLPLPPPVKGGSVDELRRFINVKEDRDFVLIVAWIIAALRGRGPYPVQALYGEQGSCKSTAQKMQRALVDPNKSPLRSAPKEPRDLMIAASNSLVVGFDNLSNVPTWLSDALCRLSTGGGFSTRELYSDADEMIFDAMRPLMFNGITDIATRPDLLDRSVLITLTPITEADRKPEDELWRDFHEARPRILGALLDAVAVGLANINTVKLDRLPRMADFAKWVTACEPGLGWKPGTFMQTYLGNRATANESAIEGSAIGTLMVKLMEDRDSFTGIAKELMEAVEGMLPKDKSDNAKLPAGWPKSARAFSGEVRRIAPNLRAAGINVAFGTHTKRGTPIILEQVRKTPSSSSPSSQAWRDNHLRGDHEGDCQDNPPSPAPSLRNPRHDRSGDEGDEGDGQFSLSNEPVVEEIL